MGGEVAARVPVQALSEVWATVRKLLLASFPAEELGSVDQVYADIASTSRALWVNDRTDVAAVAITCDLATPAGDVLLELLAVDPAQRSLGLGSQFLRSVLAEVGRPVILEVEDPDVIATHEATRRIRFYERLGGTVLPCGRGYMMPNLASGHGALPMRLIEMDVERARELRGNELRGLVKAMWIQAYSRGEDDSDLLALLDRLAC